jgi:tubulin monoglycylase TTLL3/8
VEILDLCKSKES